MLHGQTIKLNMHNVLAIDVSRYLKHDERNGWIETNFILYHSF